MRKIITISFVVLLFLSQAGYYFYYAAQREVIREDMKEKLEARLPESSLNIVILEDHALAIDWMENGKEFSLDGRLYDVAKSKKQDGKTLLYCIDDKQESRLLQDLANFVKAGSDTNMDGKSTRHTLKFQLNDYIVYLNEKIIDLPFLINPQHFDFHDAAIYPAICEVNAPPPRV